MKRLNWIGMVLIVLLLTALAPFLVVAQDESMAEPVVQNSMVHRFADMSEVAGGFAHLTRFENGVTMAVSTNDLVEGDVYTVWWVIFNAPENCSDGVCNVDDVLIVQDGIVPRDEDGNRLMNMEGIAAANVSIQHAAGGYAEDGTLHTSASLGIGDVPGIIIGPGLLDAQNAEIHLVIRTHGPATGDSGIFADQISTFGGGCEPMDALPCDDVQFAVFTPPM
jgi:hypothetical protein